MMSKFGIRKKIKERSIKNLIIVSTYNVVFLISHMWCYDAYFAHELRPFKKKTMPDRRLRKA